MSTRVWVECAIAPETNTLELYAHMPYENGSNRYWLKRVLGKRVRLEPVQRNGSTAWKLSPEHLLPWASAMADEYGEIEMRLEMSRTMQCDTNCKGADPTTVWRCVCACVGENHGGVGRYKDWYRAGRTTLIRHDKTEVKQVVITRGQIQLPKKTPKCPPSTAKPVATVRPLPRPQPLRPPQPRPATAPAPHTRIATPNRPGDLGRLPNDFVPQPTARPAPPVPVPVRRGLARPLIAALLMLVVLSGGVWAVAQPRHPAARQVTNQETIQPSTTQELPPPPAPPTEEATTTRPLAPAGCYPFQPNC